MPTLLPHTLGHAHLLWHRDYEAACARQTPQLRTRVVTDRLTQQPRAEHYQVQPKPAPSTCKNLMTRLVTLGIKALEQRNRQPDLDFAPVDEAAPVEVPSISVNCKMLGAYCNLSARTIRTHIGVLLKLGAITRKQGHGTRANFELWLNPKYVCKTPESTGENAENSPLTPTRLASILTGEATKFPLSVAFETLETEKEQPSAGEKIELLPREARQEPGQPAAGSGLATLAGNTGPLAEGEPAAPAAEMGAQGARRGRARKTPSPATAAPSGPQTVPPAPPTAFQKQLVMSLWAYARPLLYPDRAFDPEQHQKAHRAIWAGVFRGFPAGVLTEREWERYHQQALERCDLVADWLKRNPERFLPAPYAELVQGRGYFDAANQQGFVATEAWLVKKLANQYQYRMAEALRLAEKEIRGYRRRTAPKRVLALTYSQLYHKHFTKIKAFNNEQALRQFAVIAAGGPPANS